MQIRAALLSLGAVAVVTGVIFALDPFAPVLSLGVLYLFAVLPVAALWGLGYAIGVSVVSMLAFNFFFLPPTHTLQLADSENWVALAVYMFTAITVSELATHARRRARSDEVKTAVLRSVSHDLRSPITAIMTASDVLEDAGEALTPAEREELHLSIRLQIHRLDRLVSNLLDLSRLEAGAAQPVRELWTVDGLIARALEAVGPENDRIDVIVPDESPPVSVDAAQIEHALVNLLENALKFSSVTDSVEMRAEVSDAEVILRITDHGPGIPAGEQDQIFEPFHGSGSGLGLAIARGFVQLNDGRIWVQSEPSSGTTFVLAFPAVRTAAKVRT
jgi:two-component system sensor histidine kinase KdpD